jgi:hypothetical protein
MVKPEYFSLSFDVARQSRTAMWPFSLALMIARLDYLTLSPDLTHQSSTGTWPFVLAELMAPLVYLSFETGLTPPVDDVHLTVFAGPVH